MSDENTRRIGQGPNQRSPYSGVQLRREHVRDCTR
jgi:hypothetical protein